eukprot:933817-Rhodomonas_salina.1
MGVVGRKGTWRGSCRGRWWRGGPLCWAPSAAHSPSSLPRQRPPTCQPTCQPHVSAHVSVHVPAVL